jgi:type IV secretion system protein VirD4
VNPDDLHRLRPVLALFFQQAIGLQTRTLPEHDPTLKRQVLMLLDEFTALGRIPIIAESVSYLPGYNVRVLLVIQTPAQLREVYGANGAETMLKSLAARIVFAPKDVGDAREISDELGNTTVKVKTHSRPLMDLSESKGRRQRSVSVSDQRRALLLPQEVKALGNEQAIVFYEGLRPIRCRKIRYFEDPRFTRRLLPAPEVLQQKAAEAQPPSGSPTGPRTAPSEALRAVETVERDATAEDIERIESLTLEEFAADFSAVKLPTEGRMSEDQMKDAVENFLETLRER